MKPILFIIGTSGVGKSHASKLLKRRGFLCLQIDTDSVNRTFEANGLPKEWDHDFQQVNVARLVALLKSRIEQEYAGLVVSFPTVHIFTPARLAEASGLGAIPLVLWGTQEHCMKAAQERIQKKGGTFNRSRYERLNGPTFVAYGGREYDRFRVEAFRSDGGRFSDDQLMASIFGRLANIGLQPTAAGAMLRRRG